MRSPCESLFRYLPDRLMRCVARLDELTSSSVSEVRLRTGGLFIVCGGGNTVVFDAQGKPAVRAGAEMTVCTQEELDECIDKLCSYSRYSFEGTIRNGYIPLPDGSRAGVCGNAVCRDGAILSFSPITSVNIRLRRFVPRFAEKLVGFFDENGIASTLVISPPLFGKTTLLSSLVSILSERGLRVGVADERGEIHITGNTDIITGCPKAQAIEILTRTMSEQVIVCDEISHTESDAVIQTQNAGVALVASLHAQTLEESKRRPFANAMLEANVFSYAVVIGQNYEYTVMKI